MAAAAVALMWAGGGASAAEPIQDFQIAPQPLPAALLAYGQATNQSILFSSADLRGLSSEGLRGRYDRSEALDRLLAGRALGWRRMASGAILVEPRNATHPQAGAAAERPPGTADEPERLAELVVVGSRLARLEDGPTPATVFDGDKIRSMGVANVADVLNYLPQQSFSFGEGWNLAGERNVQLRGLGTGTTLVLINGRRVIPGANAAARGVVDLNAIPLSAVERVEVLADSASAVYGADAVGGVLNIVLKSSIDRPVLDLYYGAADGGGEERRASVSLGGESERARGAIVLDYFRRDFLTGFERDYMANADYRRFGGRDARFPYANPGNICAVSGNLPGLPTPCAAVPAGSTGVGLTPANFLATAGQQNMETWYSYISLVPEAKRYGAVATGSYDLTPDITAFAEYMFSDRSEVSTSFPGAVISGLVPANNPFNPFGVAVRANYLLEGLGPTVSTSTETAHRETLGLRGDIGRWYWELAFVGAQSDARTQTEGNVNAARVTAALAGTTPATALNVFQDGPGGDAALLGSLLADPSLNRQYKSSDDKQFGGFVRGSLFDLPAGPLQAVIGGEWRQEKISVVQPAGTLKVTEGQAKRDSSSAYVELRAPLLGGGSGFEALGDLALTLAGRYDDFSDFGDTFNAEYGAEWRPARSLLIRAAYGESFRAPTLFQLYQPRTTQPNTSFARDPQRQNQAFVATLISGGNTNLEPETSTSSSFGAVWEPEMPGRPRFSATYWRIQQDLRIVTGFNYLTLLANEAYVGNRIVRAAPTPADVALGLRGAITSIDVSLLNLGSLDTKGLDLSASARFETAYGRFSPSITATRVEGFKAADFPSTPAIERVGLASTAGSIPRWKLVAGLNWARQGVDLTVNARHTGSYDDVTSAVRNGRKVKAITLVDAQAAFRIDELAPSTSPFARGLTLRLGATNLFDKTPPFSEVQGLSYDPSQADPRQRFLYAALSKTF